MRKITNIHLIFLSIVVSLLTVTITGAEDTSRASGKKPLSLLIWSDYIDPSLIAGFSKAFNTKVKEVYFETDEEREQKLAYTSGKGYDLVLVSGPYIASHVRRNWTAPLDLSRVPNMVHVEPRWRDAYPQARTHAVPYLWGSLGIAWRTDLVPGEITSWAQLFQPAPELKGKIGMINDSKEVIGIALKALGHSLNSFDPSALASAEALLMKQKSYVYAYAQPDITAASPMLTGKIHMRMTYSGDALNMLAHTSKIRFTTPREGTGIWIDYLTVTESSENKELAFAFINYLNEPENAAKLAAYFNFATPNKAAKAHLSREHLENPVIYPPQSVLQRSEFYKSLPPRAQRKRNHIFSRLTR